MKRGVLLPRERNSPRANDDYFQIHLTRITQLPHPIKNTTPRRVSFGFTTLARLKKAWNILELYNVTPIEEIVGTALAQAGIEAIPQYQVSRYRLDFAILSLRGTLAIECDNKKAHGTMAQRARDKKRDAFLRTRGWRIIHLKEDAIIFDLDSCIARIRSKLYCIMPP